MGYLFSTYASHSLQQTMAPMTADCRVAGCVVAGDRRRLMACRYCLMLSQRGSLTPRRHLSTDTGVGLDASQNGPRTKRPRDRTAPEKLKRPLVCLSATRSLFARCRLGDGEKQVSVTYSEQWVQLSGMGFISSRIRVLW